MSSAALFKWPDRSSEEQLNFAAHVHLLCLNQLTWLRNEKAHVLELLKNAIVGKQTSCGRNEVLDPLPLFLLTLHLKPSIPLRFPQLRTNILLLPLPQRQPLIIQAPEEILLQRDQIKRTDLQKGSGHPPSIIQTINHLRGQESRDINAIVHLTLRNCN